MKTFMFALFMAQSFVVVHAFAKAPAKKPKSDGAKILCDQFQAKEDEECAHIMCDDDIKNGTWKNLEECTSAEDYAEGAQGVCDDQANSVENQVAEYNKTHTKKISCGEN